MKYIVDFSHSLAAAKEKRALNKPFRTPDGPKKFAVYVKNDKGNIVKVTFGDPNMEIKRDNPERQKSYRARHHCETPGPKWKANYWSCKMWSSKPVSSIASRNEPHTPTKIGDVAGLNDEMNHLNKIISPTNPLVQEQPSRLKELTEYYYEKPVLVDPNEDWDGYTWYSEDDILKSLPELRNVEPCYDDEVAVNKTGKEYPYDAPLNPEREKELKDKF
jgi:hypothetical protein